LRSGSSRTQRRTSTGRRRSSAARDRFAPIAALQAGLDRLPVGFALFDAKRELVAWNSVLASICGYPKSLLAAGTPVEAFLRHHAERGDYGSGDAQALVRERLRMLRRKSPQQSEQRLTDGRLIRITSLPVPPRGLLVTCEDVSDARLAEQRYDIASRAVNEGIYDWDLASGRIYFSDRVYHALGLSPKDFQTGADWRGRIHPDDLAGFDARLLEHFKSKTDRFECDYRFRARDGNWRWARQHGIALRDERGRAIRLIGSTGDINELKQNEQELRRAHEETSQALERQTATAEILHAIASSPTDVQPVLDAIAARSARLCEARDAIILLREGDAMRFAAHYGPIPNRPVGATRRLSPDTASGRSILEGRQIHIHDLQAETAEYPEGSAYAREFGYHSTLVTPLTRGGAAIGTILVRRTEVRPFDEKHMALIRTFADQAVIAIENVRLFNETKEALERQTATAEILRAISGSPADVTPVFETILSNATRLCDSPLAAIFRFDGKLLHLVATKNWPPEALATLAKRYPMPPDRSQTSGRTILTKSIVLQPDTLADSEYDPAAAAAGRWRRMLGVPMLREGEPIGAFVVAWPEPGETPERHVQLLKTFADQAVIAVENVRLFNETREALERQTATAEILKVIASSPSDVQPVFDAIAQSAYRLIGGFSTAVARVFGDVLHLVAFSSTGEAGNEALKGAFPMPVARSKAARSGTPVCIGDTEALPDSAASLRELARVRGFRSIVIVPMLREGVATGTISVTRKGPGEFSNHQVDLLKTFADQAVIATENVRLFNETREALERQTATAEILRVISSSPTDVQPVFEAIVTSAQRLMGAFSAAVTRIVDDRLHLAAFTSTGETGDQALKSGYPRALSEAPTHGRAVRSGAPCYISDTEKLPDEQTRAREMARTRGYRSVLIVPMLRDDMVVGTISVTHREPGKFSKHQIELLTTFAAQAVIAIENVRLFNETKEALERQTATAAVLRVISASLNDLGPVFAEILDHATRLCEAEFGFVFTSDGQAFDPVAQRGLDAEKFAAWSAAFRPHRIPGPLSGLGRILSTKVPVLIADIADDEAYRARDPLRVLTVEVIGARTFLAVPLIKESAVIGAVVIYRREVRPFSQKQVALLQTFADQAVIAIENVRLFNEINEALKQQTATAEVLKAISRTTFDLDSVLQTLLDNATVLCGAKRGVILRQDADGGFRPAVTHGWAQDSPVIEAVRARPLKPERGSATGRALLERRAIHIPDVLADPEYERRDLAIAGTYRTLLNVPMLRDGEPIGVISLTKGTDIEPFADKQIELVTTFADQAVIAIENVRLFNETKESLERQTATAEILKVISSSPTDIQPVFEAIVRNATRLCQSAYANVFRFDGELLHYVTSHGWPPHLLQNLLNYYPARPDRLRVAGRVILKKQAVRVEDTLADLEYDPNMARAMEYRRILGIPLLREDSVIGAITVGWTEPGAIQRKHEELLRTFADQAVIAIENVRLFKELQQRTEALSKSVQQLTALGEVSQAISSTLDLETVLKTIVTRALQISGLEGGAIYEYDEQVEEFQLRAAENLPEDMLAVLRRTPIRKGDGPVGMTVITREPSQIPEMRDEGYQTARREFLLRAGYRALLVVPMLREDHVIGALSVSRKTPGEFPPEVVELLKTFATQSAMAIQNARLFREIAEKGRQLEVASRHKSQFLASMSHELRTPLNAILGFNEMILDQVYGELPEDLKAPLENMQSSGKHLLRLINNVLDLAKIEAGRMELALSDYSVQDTVASVHSTLKPLAADKGLEFLASAPSDIPLAHGDGGRIAQCLMNLGGNSLKFTKAGKVEISVAQRDSLLVFRVADTGIGIPPDKIGSLFTEFKQTDATIASEYGGTGLGLSITKKFIEMHGGRIWVESQPGKGSTFIFEVPLRAGAA